MGSTENQLDHVPSINKEADDACLYAMHLSTSSVFSMVLKAAIELNLFDIIARASPDAYVSTSEIASQLPTKNPNAPSLLDSMLRFLTSYSLLTCSVRTGDDGRVQRLYALSPAGKFYVQNEDGHSLRSVALYTLHPAIAAVWLRLKDAVLEEGNLFEKVHGKSIFQYMDGDPTTNELLCNAMAGLSGINANFFFETYKEFEGVSLLVDVGGGTGTTLNTIISKYPSIKGINFDLPQVIKRCPILSRLKSKVKRYAGVEHVEGDMFEGVPKGDAIILKSTCHDWSDEHCIRLLKNCNKALQENGKVIIIDFLMPEASESSTAAKHVSIIDNGMVFFTLGGKERTAEEFEALSKSSGFFGFQVICRAYNVLGVMELHK